MVLIRGGVADFGANPDQATVLSWWQQDPSWRHVLSDAEWDTTAIPGVGTKVSGAVEVARWWGDWTDAWESYSYRTREYRDLGDRVLTELRLRHTDRATYRSR